MQTLYRRNSIGISEWTIWCEANVIKIAHSTIIGGAKVIHEETVASGKQSRTLDQQVQHRIASRISKQKDKGYTECIEKASAQLLNQLGLDVPMLAQVYNEEEILYAHVQRKLDGLRCLATKQDGQIIMYSRRGKVFEHLHEIRKVLKDLIPEGETFDGELYCHGTSLQTIQSWVKRRQSDTLKLQYIIYDHLDDVDFPERLSYLQSNFNRLSELGIDTPRVMLLPTKLVKSKAEIYESMEKARNAGFEGLIIRKPGYGYENGKRSKSLLKFKALFSDEAICIGIQLSEKGNPVCYFDWNGKRFKASPPGSHDERYKAFVQQAKYIGQRCTFEYRELTDDGIPFHAVAVNWRED